VATGLVARLSKDEAPAEFRQFIITSYRWIKKAAL